MFTWLTRPSEPRRRGEKNIPWPVRPTDPRIESENSGLRDVAASKNVEVMLLPTAEVWHGSSSDIRRSCLRVHLAAATRDPRTLVGFLLNPTARRTPRTRVYPFGAYSTPVFRNGRFRKSPRASAVSTDVETLGRSIAAVMVLYRMIPTPAS